MLINGVITTMLLLLFTARPALSEYSTIGAGTILCKPFCKGPCSGFSRPDIECNGCGEDMTCNPNADDYHKGMYDSTEDRAAAEATDVFLLGGILGDVHLVPVLQRGAQAVAGRLFVIDDE